MESNTYYTWETKEYEKKEVSNDWFWAVGIITLVIFVLSIIFKSYLFGVLIVIGVLSLFYTKMRDPKNIEIKITDRYIKIGEEEKYYQDVRYFWIEIPKDEINDPTLLIANKTNFSPLITIKIPREIKKEDLRTKLLEHIEEKKMEESKIYEAMEKLGF
jgi:hypothetical protein